MHNQPFIDKLAWILIHEDSVLCVRSTGKDAFYLPGGKREPGESDEGALAREIREELSVDLVPQSVAFAAVFEAQADAKPPGVSVRLTCYTADYVGTLAPSAEIAELAWIPYTGRGRCSLAARVVFDWLKEQGRLAS